LQGKYFNELTYGADIMCDSKNKPKKHRLQMSDIPNPIPMPGKVDKRTKAQRKQDLREYFMLGMLALVVGIIVGLGAMGFRYLINIFRNIFFLASPSLTYDSYQHFDADLAWLAGDLGWLVIIIPAIGGLLVGLLVKYGAPEVKGHGVPEVMEATITKGGRIRPRVGFIKALASAITIGSGGSAGREGPIIAIGSSAGSAIAQYLNLSDEKIRILVACGASAGIAATFNAPIAAVVFSLEIILLEFRTKSFVPLVVSSVMATVIAHLFMGNEIAFPIRDIVGIYTLNSPYELVLYLILGLLAGIMALFFMKFFYNMEDIFDRINMPQYIKPMLGGLILGIAGLLLFTQFDHVFIFGTGYGEIMPVLTSSSDMLFTGVHLASFFLLLMFMKMLATSLTLGSGASGGVFAPSLWMGAMLGGAFGVVANVLFPGIAASYGAYALVGMAAFFSGTSRATLTAIIILFEMTSTYEIILPLMFSCVVADAVSRILSKETIYTMKMKKKGVTYSYEREVNILETKLVEEVMIKDIVCIENHNTLDQVSEKILSTGFQGFPCIDDDGKLTGIFTHSDVKNAMCNKTEKNTLICKIKQDCQLIVTYPDDTLETAMELMAEHGFGHMPVVDRDEPTKLVGFLTRNDIIQVYRLKAKEREDKAWK